MVDLMIALIAICFLAVLLKPIVKPGDSVDDSFSGISVLVLILGIAIYFYNINIFPPGGRLDFLHQYIEKPLVYAISIIDVFFVTALGMPLSTRLMVEILFPCAIIYRVTKSMLNFVAILSKATVTLIAGTSAFIMLVSTTYGGVNILTLFFTAISELFTFFAGLFANTLANVAFNVFVAGVVIIAFGIFFETIAVILTSEILRGA